MGGNKNLHIETLRGIAILMVVLGHVIGSGTTGGLKIDYPSEWRYVYCWIDLIQMPLFTAIAGWAYSLKPIKIRLSDYFSGKFKRLIIPMMIVAPTYYLLQSLVPGTNSSQSLSEIWRIFIFSYSIYWYLPAIFLIFVIMAIVDHCKGADSLKKWSILFVVSMSAALVSQNTFIENIPNFFCFKSAINQLPYFLIGVLVNRFKDSVNDKKLFIPIGIVSFIISFYAIHKEWLNLIQGSGYSYYHNIILTVTVCGLLLPVFFIKFNNHYLSNIGKYSFSIYLFHVFFTSSSRLLFNVIYTLPLFVLIPAITYISVWIPILMDDLLSEINLSKKYILGK